MPYNVAEAAMSVVPVIVLIVGFTVLDFDVTGALLVVVAGYYAGAGIYLALLMRHRRLRCGTPTSACSRRWRSTGFASI